MQIKKVVLYSHDGKSRSLDFQLGSLNIITGRKGTGKSALIRILEYCFGSTESKIPAGIIREKTSWYAVLLSFPDVEMFVARAEPAPGFRSSTKIYIDIGTSLEVPRLEDLEQNTTTDALIETLSQRLGIANIETQRAAESTQNPYKITIAHALFFNFQRQDEIAKPTLLFHRQDEQFIDTHIRDVLPYFLGAMDEGRLMLMQRLRQERTERRRLERLLESLQPDIVNDPRAIALVEEANAVGLLDVQGQTQSDAIELLRSLDVNADPALNIEGFEEALERRRNDREELLLQQRSLRNRIERLRALNREEAAYDRELDSQRARLKTVDLMHTDGSMQCPVCEQSITHRLPSVAAVSMSIQKLSAQLETITASRPKIEETIGKLESTTARIRSELQENQAVINSIESRTARLKAFRDAHVASAVVRGRIQFYLENVTAQESETIGLRHQIAAVTSSIRELEERLSLESVEERMDSVLRFIEDDMTKWSVDLDLEYRTHVRLDPRKLTVVADTENGLPLPLERMGSGANWLGYHVVTYAALHHWFEQHDRPVPRFVVFDQPTQVFYPQDSDGESELGDDDRKRVAYLFRFFLSLSGELDHKVQLIVTDHATLDCPEFKTAVIANWHNEEGLVPGDWPARETES